MNTSPKAYPITKLETVDCLVICDSDPRFTQAIQRFIEEELRIETPALMVIPGGIHDLISPARVKAARQLWQHLEFMVKENKLRRLVVISNEDSLWYKKWNTLVLGRVSEEIASHLYQIVEKLVEKHFDLDIQLFQARIENEAVLFQEIQRK
jgi:hypothetical protein